VQEKRELSRVSPARRVAFRVLERVSEGGHANDLLYRECLDMESRDAGLAEEITLGVLRRQGQLDYLIEEWSGRDTEDMDLPVLIALRMGAYQMMFLDRIPPHAAVSESVELARMAGQRSAVGFVNAVLRKARKGPVEWPTLSLELGTPGWLLQRWDQQFGEEAAEGIARAALLPPEKHRRGDRFMDIGSQSIVPLLELQPGMRMLDLCAAPGNKTAQALETPDVFVVACDRQHRRLEALRGMRAELVVLDAAEALPLRPDFDRILVDAPCSGTGTLGRNPEIKWRMRPGDLLRQQERQVRILRNALELLRPGGRLVYSTCSLEVEENEHVIEHPHVRGARTCSSILIKNTMHRLPGRDPGDGFFAAVMEVA
jgi:16S rRNA (cytosine967-C5)-methyltransferase